MLPDCRRREDEIEEYEMKHCLLVAFLALGGAACDHKPAAPTDAGEADAGAPDATVPVDLSRPDMQSPDTDMAPVPDGAAPAPDSSPAVDAGGTDLAPDLARADTGVSTRPDARADTAPTLGADCGAGGSREMLCTTYCDGMTRFCTGSNSQYRSADECRAACAGTAWACGSSGETTGNSLFCRLAHMALAGVGSASAECPNAGPRSVTCQ
jgi:hypothetical protein